MIRIDFYVLQAGARLDRERLICRLANKAFEQGQPLYIHAAASEEAERLDDLLWTFRDISFLPHQLLHEGYTPDIPIFIGCGDAPPGAMKLMINLAHPAPPFRSCLAKNHIHLSRVILSMAMRIMLSTVAVTISKSLANRRNPPNQAKVRSTIERLGSTVNPSPSFVTLCKANPRVCSTNLTAVPRYPASPQNAKSFQCVPDLAAMPRLSA
jgi:DNA polymerase III subunit chi